MASETEDKYKECLMMERSEEENPRFRRHPIVQVALHEPAYLHCIIPQFSHNLVAWTRVSDEALLTAGENSFTSDPRFQVSVKSSDSDWVLIIRRAEKSDSGCYLCEVNTEPKSTVYAVYLNVIERTTKLMANMVGDEVLLNCTITLSNGTSSLDDEVQWSRDGRPIDFSNSNSECSFLLERTAAARLLALELVGSPGLWVEIYS
ncbi:unnamed protein product [Toxocara canis]|uniref:Ig-like domain-containing protein n=1 Tax=Toxocara canis TaxID=6265 RepID=A0A3P7IIC1_TOXCA|nr:unnamed protein product [Toxocara canis]